MEVATELTGTGRGGRTRATLAGSSATETVKSSKIRYLGLG